MLRLLVLLAVVLPLLAVAAPPPVAASAPAATAATPLKVRLKDVTRIQGVESQTLVGYGLVVGLAATGDSDEELTQRTIANMLKNFNIAVDRNNIKAQNTAAVMVTVVLNKPVHAGDRVAATVACIGDAAALTGGELLLTPVLGPDGTMWGTAQGAVVTNAFQFGDGGQGGEKAVKNHPTTGRVTAGVTLLRDIGLGLAESDVLTICLQHADNTTAVNLADAVCARFPGAAVPQDAATVKVRVPKSYMAENRVMEFIREIEGVEFAPDQVAKIVFNERTGTMIFGGNVRISSVAVTHGNLAVTVKNTELVSQPPPLAPRGSETVQVRDQATSVAEERVPVHVLPAVTTVGDLVSVLNALGVTPRDMIIIMHALKTAGALHAEIESM